MPHTALGKVVAAAVAAAMTYFAWRLFKGAGKEDPK